MFFNVHGLFCLDSPVHPSLKFISLWRRADWLHYVLWDATSFQTAHRAHLSVGKKKKQDPQGGHEITGITKKKKKKHSLRMDGMQVRLNRIPTELWITTTVLHIRDPDIRLCHSIYRNVRLFLYRRDEILVEIFSANSKYLTENANKIRAKHKYLFMRPCTISLIPLKVCSLLFMFWK